MKTKFFYFTILLLLPLVTLAQNKERKILRGHIIADSLQTGDVTVQNVSSHITAVTDGEGYFTLYARAGDTLFFNSFTYRSAYLALKPAHLLENPLTIRLDVNVTVLDEVIITPNPLTGKLEEDAKNAKVAALNPKLKEDLKYKYPIPKQNVNGALPVTESVLQGVDFIAIGKMLFKSKKRRKDRGEIYGKTASKTFSEVVNERFTHYFFTETLKIPPKEIGLFLTFCDKGDATIALLDPKMEFELTDYLITQSEEYRNQKK